MKSIHYFAAIFAAAALLPQVNAQPSVLANPAAQIVYGATIGPDGTYYALVPGTGSTAQSPSTALLAIANTAGTTPKWTATLTGTLGPVLPGETTVFAVQNVTTGNGRHATTTTSILLLSAASGAHTVSITPAGNISDIQVRTIGGSDYLYVTTLKGAMSADGENFITTRTVTIYSATGAVIRTEAL